MQASAKQLEKVLENIDWACGARHLPPYVIPLRGPINSKTFEVLCANVSTSKSYEDGIYADWSA
jgi:hypothetical protein